jgi:hypothetical protein
VLTAEVVGTESLQLGTRYCAVNCAISDMQVWPQVSANLPYIRMIPTPWTRHHNAATEKIFYGGISWSEEKCQCRPMGIGPPVKPAGPAAPSATNRTSKKVLLPALRIPSHQNKHRIQAAETGKQREAAQDTPRRSGRLATKLKANKAMEQQEVELITTK